MLPSLSDRVERGDGVEERDWPKGGKPADARY
jgi:hypothetical protein